MTVANGKRAVFLDRDGVINVDKIFGGVLTATKQTNLEFENAAKNLKTSFR